MIGSFAFISKHTRCLIGVGETIQLLATLDALIGSRWRGVGTTGVWTDTCWPWLSSSKQMDFSGFSLYRWGNGLEGRFSDVPIAVSTYNCRL